MDNCRDHCLYARLCRMPALENRHPDACYEYMHWDDMAMDTESAKGDYYSKYDEPEVDEDAEESKV